MDFGMTLRALRIEHGWTQQQLGDMIGKTKNNISQYELGKREPDIHQLLMFSRIFGVSMSELVRPEDFRLEEREAPSYSPEVVLVPVYETSPLASPIEYRAAPGPLAGDVSFYCYAAEDALYFRIQKGDLLYVCEEAEPVESELMLLQVGNRVMLRSMVRAGGTLFLLPSNPGTAVCRCEPDLRVLGRVLNASFSVKATPHK